MKTEDIALIGVGLALVGVAAWKFGVFDRFKTPAPAPAPLHRDQIEAMNPTGKTPMDQLRELFQPITTAVQQLPQSKTTTVITDQRLRDEGVYAYRDLVNTDGTTTRQTHMAGLGYISPISLVL